MATRSPKKIDVETLTHDAASRKNIPTAEYESILREDEKSPIQVAYERRNRDLDPQLVWRGKDDQDISDLVVQAPPLYIQEKLHPKALIDELKRESKARRDAEPADIPDLFADFNGLPDVEARTEFYAHDQHWSNRMILGDSLQVMASLAAREGLRGKVQCIYLDPPYGIRFNSNFQWSTTSRDVKDGKPDHITREPEQVKAFRDTWRDGIHSYLTYLRDRLTVARDLLTDSGSIFVQIGDENVHRVRALMDEVFGEYNKTSEIVVQKTSGQDQESINNVTDYILWYAKSLNHQKFRKLYSKRPFNPANPGPYGRVLLTDGTTTTVNSAIKNDNLDVSARIFRWSDMSSSGHGGNTIFPFEWRNTVYKPSTNRHWSTHIQGLRRLDYADRINGTVNSLSYIRFFEDYPYSALHNIWDDTSVGGFTDTKLYVVQTVAKAIERCILMTTDPGDLVLDPTCGSGTTAYVAEQWGRRWITIDTSRVALALARSRLMGARYSYYLLADSEAGQIKEGEVTRTVPKTTPTRGDVRQGFVYERVPHITLKSIANNAEIDVIWGKFQETLEPLREQLNATLTESWDEWQIPREAEAAWPDEAKKLHERWWQARIERQKEIDASIAAKADVEFLYDKPYVDKSAVRVAGPFTVESLSPHRTLAVDHDDELLDPQGEAAAAEGQDFSNVVLEHLKTSGVQQAKKDDKITFDSLSPWPGELISAEGSYDEGEDSKRKRAAILIGPEFGTLNRPDLVRAAREAADAAFDILIACAFNYDAHAGDFSKLGKIPVLKARINPDLHMADDLKNTGGGNLFVVFGEPDIDIEEIDADTIRVRINGVDVFHPSTGKVQSDGPDGIAVWFIDTDYNEESFFVRQAYFPGTANDPYKALKTTLKAEIDEEAWESLRSSVSRPFMRPASGRIAVKVINHLGDEVMKVYRVD
ncbi:MAG: site-specific DNA-methyltransferase [Pseudomonadota bacterium]